MSMLYWYYFYGNDFNDYCTFRFWNLSHDEKKSYISFRRNDKLRFALSTPEIYKVFLDKTTFNQRFSSYINRRWIEIKEGESEKSMKFIDETGSAIFKPRSDYGGHGVIKISKGQNFIPQCDGIMEECIENSTNLKKLASNSLNTIRIVTLIDKAGHLHILACVLRMGNGNGFTDNYHDGGMAVAIDSTSGKLTGKAYGMNCMEYTEHPLTKVVFNGYSIDNFSECINLVKKLAYETPTARYVGWDLAITPKGIEVIEGNIPPGEDITQVATGRGIWYEVKKMI